MKLKVLITDSLPPVAAQFLAPKYQVTRGKFPLSGKQLLDKVRPYHALLTTLEDSVTAKVLEAAPHLKCVANYAVGFNNIDWKAAQRMGIWVTNTPGLLTEATADIAWALILSCARRLPEGDRMVRKGKFKGWRPLLLLGSDLTGKTLGVFGFGRIGKAVARRGKGWGMKILYHQRHRESPKVERELNSQFVSFETLLRQSDILSVNAPLTPETQHRFTRLEFKKMKPKSIFINSSRGLLHQEKDLALALRKGWIGAAGLDVYEREPKVDSGLLSLPNTTLLPHLGSATVETRTAMALLAARNIDLVLRGKKPATPVFPSFS